MAHAQNGRVRSLCWLRESRRRLYPSYMIQVAYTKSSFLFFFIFRLGVCFARKRTDIRRGRLCPGRLFGVFVRTRRYKTKKYIYYILYIFIEISSGVSESHVHGVLHTAYRFSRKLCKKFTGRTAATRPKFPRARVCVCTREIAAARVSQSAPEKSDNREFFILFFFSPTFFYHTSYISRERSVW